MRDWLGVGDSPSWDDAVRGVCSTQCMLYLVFAVLGVCCTRCRLYSVYAVLCVDSWSWHGEIEMEDLTSCAEVIVELRTRQREMRAHGGNHPEKLGLKRIWCASQCTIPNTAGTSPDPACDFSDTKSSQTNRPSRTRDLSYPVVPSTLFPSSFSISLPRPQPNYHYRTQSYVIPRYLSMLWSWVDTEYSILRPQHTPSTVYTQYGILPRLFFIPSISWLQVDPSM